MVEIQFHHTGKKDQCGRQGQQAHPQDARAQAPRRQQRQCRHQQQITGDHQIEAHPGGQGVEQRHQRHTGAEIPVTPQQ
jgi:hypothetical protein